MNTDSETAIVDRLAAERYPHQDITREIIGAAFEVHNVLGHGFLEKVYENALVVELRSRGLRANAQVPIPVSYKGELVGDYIADLVVNGLVLCEIKAAASLDPSHQAQILNYLKASAIKIGLLINFGPKRVETKRMAM
jgi:GxxExxY protein